jgi:putative iron-dependent peroxidase
MSTPSAASPQGPILAPVPGAGRFLVLDLRVGADPHAVLSRLPGLVHPQRDALGLGEPLVRAAGATVPGLRTFPAVTGPGCAFPSTQGALWAFIGADEVSEVHDRCRALYARLLDVCVVREEVPAFRYLGGRDLSGYEDGTENPKGGAAIEAAIVSGGAGLDGSSFVAVQKWVHDLESFGRLAQKARDHAIGRRLSDNEEIEDAPESAHVKRAAQESFDPPAFMVRRSMAWGGVSEHGLYFVAYGRSFDAYERVLSRMAGRDDGIVDGLMTFSHAVSGGYYWVPPLRGGALDLSALGGVHAGP